MYKYVCHPQGFCSWHVHLDFTLDHIYINTFGIYNSSFLGSLERVELISEMHKWILFLCSITSWNKVCKFMNDVHKCTLFLFTTAWNESWTKYAYFSHNQSVWTILFSWKSKFPTFSTGRGRLLLNYIVTVCGVSE